MTTPVFFHPAPFPGRSLSFPEVFLVSAQAVSFPPSVVLRGPLVNLGGKFFCSLFPLVLLPFCAVEPRGRLCDGLEALDVPAKFSFSRRDHFQISLIRPLYLPISPSVPFTPLLAEGPSLKRFLRFPSPDFFLPFHACFPISLSLLPRGLY